MRSNFCDLGVAACVVENNRILLIKESKGKHSSKWGVPKGFVESGELPAQAALRELYEECGIPGEITGIIALRERVTNGQTGVFVAYLVSPKSLKVKPNPEEVSDYGWFSIEELESVDWLSDTMHSISIASLNQYSAMDVIDSSELKNEPYIVHLSNNKIEVQGLST
tara:strand:+ start:256 stop:756 length:501 start_codon:yes stop_codon:yes gene_type:complete